MPAVSEAQRKLVAMAEHNPEKVHAKNRGVLGMSKMQMHDYAMTPEKGLPKRVRHKIGKPKHAR